MPGSPESCTGGILIGSGSSESQGQATNGWSPKGLKLVLGVIISFVPDCAPGPPGKAGVAIMDGRKAMKVRRMRIPERAGWIYIVELLKFSFK